MVTEFKAPIELTDAELDAVTGGQGPNIAVGGVLNNLSVDVDVAVDRTLNNNNVAVGVLSAIGQA